MLKIMGRSRGVEHMTSSFQVANLTPARHRQNDVRNEVCTWDLNDLFSFSFLSPLSHLNFFFFSRKVCEVFYSEGLLMPQEDIHHSLLTPISVRNSLSLCSCSITFQETVGGRVSFSLKGKDGDFGLITNPL